MNEFDGGFGTFPQYQQPGPLWGWSAPGRNPLLDKSAAPAPAPSAGAGGGGLLNTIGAGKNAANMLGNIFGGGGAGAGSVGSVAPAEAGVVGGGEGMFAGAGGSGAGAALFNPITAAITAAVANEYFGHGTSRRSDNWGTQLLQTAAGAPMFQDSQWALRKLGLGNSNPIQQGIHMGEDLITGDWGNAFKAPGRIFDKLF